MISLTEIRRVDELGRISIPKEIRKCLNIQDGQSFEVYVDGESIIFKKHKPELMYAAAIQNMITDLIHQDFIPTSTAQEVIDRLQDAVIVLQGSKKRSMNKNNED